MWKKRRRDEETERRSAHPLRLYVSSSLHLLLLTLFLTPAIACADALSAKSSVDQILDALDARGKSLQDFSASVKLTDSNDTTGDETINTGTVLLQRKGPDDARIRVVFTKKQQGDKIFTVDHEYMLDDGILTERDYQAKHETRQRVLKPAEKLDLFKLGQGPFPLPLGQSRQDVLAQFSVQKIAPASDDPPGTVHLQLTPDPNSRFAADFRTIDIWVDLAGAMPRRIQTLDLNQTTTRTTDLTDVKINTGLSDKDFALTPVSDGWDVVDQPYQ